MLEILFFVLFINVSPSISYRLSDGSPRYNTNKCEKVRSDICLKGVHTNYNSTSFPNRYQHTTQKEAIRSLNDFGPLIKLNCSPSIATFLCSLYIPICSPSMNEAIPPCRSLCETSQKGCEPILKKFGFPWQFNCTEFPTDGSQICVGADFMKPDSKKVIETKENTPKIKKKRKGWISIDEDEAVMLACKKNTFIHIRKLKQSEDSLCCPVASKSVVSAMCNGKQSCVLKNSPSTLGGHCRNKVGTLSIRYKCSTNYEEACESKVV